MPPVTQLVSGEAGFECRPRDPEHVLPSAAGHCLAGALIPVSLVPSPHSEEQDSRRAFVNLQSGTNVTLKTVSHVVPGWEPACLYLSLPYSFIPQWLCASPGWGELRRTHRPCHHGLVGIKKAGLCVSVKREVGADEVPCEVAGGSGGIPVGTGLPVCRNSYRQHRLGSQYVLTLVV